MASEELLEFNRKQWDRFLAGYSRFDKEWTASRLQLFKLGFSHMLHGYESLESLKAMHNKTFAPDFNIFRMLGRESDEAGTHTPFLRSLLDPGGSHGQGDLFFRQFWELLRTAQKENSVGGIVPLPIEPVGPVQVHSEFNACNFGRLDLLIQSAFALVAIEVKIYAGEQKDQLYRYSRYLAKQEQRNDGLSTALFYLTLHGNSSGTANKAGYTKLSFNDHIRSWLRWCLADIQAHRVSTTIKQYMELIEQL